MNIDSYKMRGCPQRGEIRSSDQPPEAASGKVTGERLTPRLRFLSQGL